MTRTSTFRAHFAGLDAADMARVDPILHCYRYLAAPVSAYRRDLLCRKATPAVSLAECVASLLDGVFVVGFLACGRKMSRVHAGGVVARVHDDKSRRDWAMDHLVREPVSPDTLFACEDHNPVPVPVAGGRPFPAAAGGLSYPRPEYVAGAKFCMAGKPVSLSRRVVMLSAQATGQCLIAADGAWNYFTRLIRQAASPLSCCDFARIDGGCHR